MKSINIVGNGLSGLLVTANLINDTTTPLYIRLFDVNTSNGKGIAYSTKNKNHLLNVTVEKMSAFYDDHLHFFNWVNSQDEYSVIDPEVLLKSYLPRKVYGQYIDHIYAETIQKAQFKECIIQEINERVIDLSLTNNAFSCVTENNTYDAEFSVLATGNNLPRNPNLEEKAFVFNPNYFQNPWGESFTKTPKTDFPFLIIGNGLTMVDTAISLVNNNIKNKIISISPNGYGILPHRGNNTNYTSPLLSDENFHKKSLLEIVCFINKERKKMRKLGLSAESLIDAIRPRAQKIWMHLSVNEKQYFLSKLRHKWGVARHRLPIQIHDRIQQLRLNNKLEVIAGKIVNIKENNEYFEVTYFEKKSNSTSYVRVERIINCTGPEQDIALSNNNLLKNMLNNGLILENELKLGVECDPKSLLIKNKDANVTPNLYTLGTNLRGMFWESTAVGEIKIQAKTIAKDILSR